MGDAIAVAEWLAKRLPQEWFSQPAELLVDRDEVLVVGRLDEPGDPGDSGDRREAALARIAEFREATRAERMRIAGEAERRFERKVSWGARCGGTQVLFTHLSIPVMTRLRMRERKVLDTLVDAGVARSRSDALAWCVRLVGENEARWIDELRDAIAEVERVRASGPGPR